MLLEKRRCEILLAFISIFYKYFFIEIYFDEENSNFLFSGNFS